MKFLLIIFVSVCTISCPVYSYGRIKPSLNDSTKWIDEFRSFRNAVYRHDIVAVKKYFRFPVINPNNEIWYLLLSEKAMISKKYSGSKPVPFTEKDFIKYYNQLFSKVFIKGLLKIKSDDLYQNAYAETPSIADGNKKNFKLIATYERGEQLLSFNISISEKSGDSDDVIENNIIYYFTILQNGRLLFKEIRLAG